MTFATPTHREHYLQVASRLVPTLHQRQMAPIRAITTQADPAGMQGWRVCDAGPVARVLGQPLKMGEPIILDMGEHVVGYVHLSLGIVGAGVVGGGMVSDDVNGPDIAGQSISSQTNASVAADAPVRLKLTMGETPAEVSESIDPYAGKLSRAWFQDEVINVDILPGQVRLPRRYAFQYLKIELLSTSLAFEPVLDQVHVIAVSSADLSRVAPLPDTVPADLRAMDAASVRTLANCMQTVFEDGPKRDRRLWLGDLRLQAMTNYATFGNMDLVKRCLYLFGGLTRDDGIVNADVFENLSPRPIVSPRPIDGQRESERHAGKDADRSDSIKRIVEGEGRSQRALQPTDARGDLGVGSAYPNPKRGVSSIFDYAALFSDTLLAYANASGDLATARDLWPVVMDQLPLLDAVDSTGLFHDPGNWWLFIDWREGLDKQASIQAVLILMLRSTIELAGKLGPDFSKQVSHLPAKLDQMILAARTQLWDASAGVFVSGATKQVSWASQAWLALAGVLSPADHAASLLKVMSDPSALKPAGPYLYHVMTHALFLAGLRDEAIQLMRGYWGQMLALGASTFWEVFDPADTRFSPYGNCLINSYCHAWSCTPAWFARTTSLLRVI